MSNSDRASNENDNHFQNVDENPNQNPISLTDQLAVRLIQGQTAHASSPPPMKACIAVAGGGSKAASAIASVPGASSMLLESIVAYDRRSFADFVSKNVATERGDDAWLLDLESMESHRPMRSSHASSSVSNDSSSSAANSHGDDNGGDASKYEDSFHFCSVQAAILFSRSALHRSMELSPGFQDKCLRCIGVGCASSLVGKSPPNRKRKSHAYVACSTLRGGTWVWEVSLSDGGGEEYLNMGAGARELNNSEMNTIDTSQIRGLKRQCRQVYSRHHTDDRTQLHNRRTRSQEETVVSNLVLLSMIRQREQLNDDNYAGEQTYQSILGQILDREGDSIDEVSFGRDQGTYIDDVINSQSGVDNASSSPTQSPAMGALQIINGKANVVAVLPVKTNAFSQLTTQQEHQHENYRMETLFSDNQIPFPRDVLIVSGSFNPPHHGHVALANAAVSALRRLRQTESLGNRDGESAASSVDKEKSSAPYSRYSSLSSFSSSSSSSSVLKNIWDTVEKYSEKQYDPTVLFEMSVTNADKPPQDPLEVERRLNLFLTLPPLQMPRDWGVILTNAPLFLQKASVLDDVIAGDDVGCRGPPNRKMTFVLGTDTMVRIINPKYYGDSQENMISALVSMKEKGVHFIVGGRLEQGRQDG